MKILRPVVFAALTILPFATFAHDYVLGAVSVAHPFAFETAKTASSGGGYMSISNAGDTPDRLLAVTSPEVSDIGLHVTETDANGVARMTHLEAIEIPAGETVTLAPGGLHVMFMNLNGDPFEIGEKIPATLMFENAGPLEITFNVESRRGASKEGDHSMHKKSN